MIAMTRREAIKSARKKLSEDLSGGEHSPGIDGYPEQYVIHEGGHAVAMDSKGHVTGVSDGEG